uniref:Uncharacterized protein n=1 Tax=Anguilla anguilla TaxID=7936 RepID=A0A0E9QV31_ANGAN
MSALPCTGPPSECCFLIYAPVCLLYVSLVESISNA